MTVVYRLSSIVLLVVLLAGCAARGQAPFVPGAAPSGPATAPAGTPSPPGQARDVSGSLTFGGYTRGYILHLPPAYSGATPFPLVINIHGGAGDDSSEVKISQMDPEADRQGFLVVYPNGTGKLGDKLLTWNAGDCCGYAVINQVDDVGFIRALIADLEQRYAIDPHRIYATGLSNGGLMSYKLACDLADEIAAIAPVAGAQDVAVCRPAQPVAVIAFHGTDDEYVPYNGGHGPKALSPIANHSVAYAMDFWTQEDGCAVQGQSPVPQSQTSGHIVHDTFSGCTAGTAVELYTVQGGGHAWPGGRAWPGGPPPTQEIAASRLMLEFFAAHPRP